MIYSNGWGIGKAFCSRTIGKIEIRFNLHMLNSIILIAEFFPNSQCGTDSSLGIPNGYNQLMHNH